MRAARHACPASRSPAALARIRGLAAAAASLLLPATALGDDLASYFGFDPLEVIKIDPKAGPFVAVDLNGDGAKDLVVVNNHKSRLDLLYQKPNATPADEPPPPKGANELPDHWRFRRESVPVAHEVRAVVPYDFDGDGMVDLIYAGNPGTIVFLRQTKPGVFEATRKVPVKNLLGSRDNLAVADVMGDSKPELIGNIGGRIAIWPMDRDSLGTPVELSAGGANVVASVLADFDGNGTTDLVGVVPEDASPIRVWFTSKDGQNTTIGPQLRFEAPPLREAEAVVLPGAKAALLGTIERPSKRVVFNRFARLPQGSAADRQSAIQTWSWEDTGNRRRADGLADLDGDGLLDLLVTNSQSNAVMAYRQRPGRGFDRPESNPSYADLTGLAVSAAPGSAPEVFALSEKEGVVGRSVVKDGQIPFPAALQLPGGATPTAIASLTVGGQRVLGAVVKDGTAFSLELLPTDGSSGPRRTVALGKPARGPEAMVALPGADGGTDVLLFTPDKPLMMVRYGADAAAAGKLIESKDMGQFGLVQSANGQNTAVHDVDGDGRPELLVADRNFIRALRFDPSPAAGKSPGWQVVEQVNAPARDTKLNSLAVMGDRLVAGDPENGRVLVFARDGSAWTQKESIEVPAFKFSRLYGGRFGGDDQESLLLLGDDGFAVVRLGGERMRMTEVAAWRSDDPRRVEHEIIPGDVNGDGFVDLVLLDAGQQTAEILTFSEAGRLLLGNQFEIFESRLFSSGEPKEYEPSMGAVVDVTGDGRGDMVLLAHDRILLYPQQAAPRKAAEGTPPAAAAPAAGGRKGS